ncbi:hypothetical protein WISP_138540 [Willisornis vidua]|uniref:Uncharacterized protein n=1 Tax=Willisornis vidua TaxID=1566151 RepID=A0ABQ9CTY0_9PASS|nr:hypothetical protein WISP_138540 [Willisornis vidua]
MDRRDRRVSAGPLSAWAGAASLGGAALAQNRGQVPDVTAVVRHLQLVPPPPMPHSADAVALSSSSGRAMDLSLSDGSGNSQPLQPPKLGSPMAWDMFRQDRSSPGEMAPLPP